MSRGMRAALQRTASGFHECCSFARCRCAAKNDSRVSIVSHRVHMPSNFETYPSSRRNQYDTKPGHIAAARRCTMSISTAASLASPVPYGRVRDVVGSLVLLLLTLPLLLLVACLIKLDSAGPAFYRQERIGLNGRVFTLLKLRSMRTDAEAGGPRWAANGDPRVTRIGRLIRVMRIDELPQLVNVLRGEMSLIGPRPERPIF